VAHTISSYGILEKNKLTSNTVWLLMLQITIPGVGTPIRITSNNESVTWRDEPWIAFPFELDDISDESKGEVPQVTLRVSNVSRVMESYLQAFDLYTKTNGYSPIEVRIYVVNNMGSFSSGVVTDTTADGAVTETTEDGATTDELYDIVNPDAEVEHVFELMNPKTNSMWATFVLGAANPFRKRYPQARILKNHCRFIFKDAWCKYVGGETICDKTLTRCRALSNSVNFGGFPGVGSGGIKVAS